MENILTIDSPQNPRVKAALKLRKASARKEIGQTLVEGFREIQRAVEGGWRFKELYFCPKLYLHGGEDALVSTIHGKGAAVFRCSETAFRRMSYRDTPDGLMALSPLIGKTLDQLSLPDTPLLLVAEDMEKPGNLGTMLRTADAAGVDAVIVCDPKTDINNPNVIRASIGTLFFLPVVETTTDRAIPWLKSRGIRTLAAVPGAELEYTDADMLGGVAIVVGSEDSGLGKQWMERADERLGIPMRGRNDSLNVSTAAAILLYEALRQRRETC